MPTFWKKHESIQSKLGRYFDECDSFFGLFEKAVRIWLDCGCGPSFDSTVETAHEAESRADDLRRDIEFTLYGKSILPESRGDLLGLLENYDIILTAAETFLYEVSCQEVVLPADYHEQFLELVEQNLRAYYLVRKTVHALMENPKATLAAVRDVDTAESRSDRQERALVKSIFVSQMDGWKKNQLKALVNQLGRISDLAEHTSDRIGIIAIKRNI
ncbi:MAG TPA: DUF47 family protein [Myxococcota bacterium]|nr:DUF47 family protein [Myxococcota bacterium]